MGRRESLHVTSGPGFSLMMEHIGYRGHDGNAMRLR